MARGDERASAGERRLRRCRGRSAGTSRQKPEERRERPRAWRRGTRRRRPREASARVPLRVREQRADGGVGVPRRVGERVVFTGGREAAATAGAAAVLSDGALVEVAVEKVPDAGLFFFSTCVLC